MCFEYTNINTKEAIQLITDYFKTRISQYILDIDITGFNEILKLILYNNTFSFDNYYFIQTNGLAMGGKCGPSIANMYVYIKEKDWLNLNSPHNIIIYNRFIDDIFIISKYNILHSNFKSIFSNLILNIIKDKEVQLLDLLISKNKYFDCLSFKLHTKSTNTFQYLYHSSNHAKHIFKNIPKSLFLIKRGYKEIDLYKICLTIGNVDRNTLIPYRDKTLNISKYNSNNFKFIINFDLNYIFLKSDFKIISNDIKNSDL